MPAVGSPPAAGEMEEEEQRMVRSGGQQRRGGGAADTHERPEGSPSRTQKKKQRRAAARGDQGSDLITQGSIAGLGAYAAVFKQLTAHGNLGTVRIPPISGGIFAGRFQRHISELTMQAIDRAVREMAADDRTKLLHNVGAIHLCIFYDDELQSVSSHLSS